MAPRGARAGSTASTAGPGGGRRGAKTAGATPTTGCVTPPGGVGVERRREITSLSLRPSETTTIWSRGPKSGDFPHVLQVHPQSGGTERQLGNFSASLHSHTTWGGDAPGGWGRTRGLGPPAAPPGTRGGPRAGATTGPRN